MNSTKTLVIVGAGAAGLAAALEALDGGVKPTLLEARTRAGGRAWTEDFPGSTLSAEIGPEFIHGLPETTLHLLERYAIPRYDVGGESRGYRNGTLVPEEHDDEAAENYFFSALDACPDEIDPTVAELFARIPAAARNEPCEREIFRLTNGFDAADPALAGARALAAEWRGDASLAGDSSKPLGGYRAVMRAAAHEITMRGGDIRFGETVCTIAANDGRFTVRTQKPDAADGRYQADAVIMTLPLPLLQSSFGEQAAADAYADGMRTGAGNCAAIHCEFEIPSPVRAALERRVMGHVVKPILRFSEPFWEHLSDGEYRGTSFFRSAPGAPFPVMWTYLPFHTPLLTFWAGGTDADANWGATNETPEAQMPTLITDANHPVIQAAFATITATFNFDAQPLFRDAIYIDWQRDRFACGAYSYARPFGQNDRALLAEPLAGGIYLAGEAFAPVGQTGTVAGAMVSGRTAVQRALENFKRR